MRSKGREFGVKITTFNNTDQNIFLGDDIINTINTIQIGQSVMTSPPLTWEQQKSSKETRCFSHLTIVRGTVIFSESYQKIFERVRPTNLLHTKT